MKQFKVLNKHSQGVHTPIKALMLAMSMVQVGTAIAADQVVDCSDTSCPAQPEVLQGNYDNLTIATKSHFNGLTGKVLAVEIQDGSAVQVANNTIVGELGLAQLNIKNASLTTKNMTLGKDFSANPASVYFSSGDVHVEGQDASLVVEDTLKIGSYGLGSLSITNNATLMAKAVYVGGLDYSEGGVGPQYIGTTNMRDNNLLLDTDYSFAYPYSLSGRNAELSITNGGVVITDEISRKTSELPQSNIYKVEALPKFLVNIDGGTIRTNQSTTLFHGFSEHDTVTVGTQGMVIDTHGHDVDIFENVTMVGDAGTYDVGMAKGGLVKTGAGTLTVSSTSLNENLAKQKQKLAGDIVVEQGALNIHGDYKLNNQTLHLGLNSLDNYGQFQVSGQLELSNSTLNLRASEIVRGLLSTDSTEQTWDNLVTAGELVGEFDNYQLVDNQGNNLNHSVHIDLKSAVNHIGITAKMKNAVNANTTTNTTTQSLQFSHAVNQRASVNDNLRGVARVLDQSMTDTTQGVGKVLDTLMSVNNDLRDNDSKKAELVQQLQSDIQSQAPQIVQQQANLATSSIAERVFQSRQDTAQGSDSDEMHSLFKRSQNINHQVWLQGIGKEHKTEIEHQSGYKGHSYGAVIGADGLVSDDFRMGVAVAYTDSDIDTLNRAQNLQADVVQGYLYGDYAVDDQVHLNGFVGYGRAKVNTKRDFDLENLVNGQATAQYDSDITQAGIGVDYRIGSLQRHISPYVQLNYTRIENDAYQEKVTDSTGRLSALGQNVSANAFDQLRATVGVHFAQPLGNQVQMIGQLAGHAEQGDDIQINTAFNGSPHLNFTQTAEEQDKYSASVGLGLRFQPTASTEISGQYHGELSKHTENHGGALMFKWKF